MLGPRPIRRHVEMGAASAPGDLVFFGGGPDSIAHVGHFVGVAGGQDVTIETLRSERDRISARLEGPGRRGEERDPVSRVRISRNWDAWALEVAA
jgi:hypothetical protein